MATTFQGWKFKQATGGVLDAMDFEDGATLTDGAVAIVTDGGSLSIYEGDADSGLVADGVHVVAPVTNAGDYRWILQRVITNDMPVGSIIGFCPGYFTASNNTGFVAVLPNTVAGVNALFNPLGFYVMDGGLLNLSGSAIFDGAGRRLPNGTTDVYLVGNDTAGEKVGSNTSSHIHQTNDAQPGEGAPAVGLVAGGVPHDHGGTDGPSVTNIQPNSLTIFWLIKAI